MLTKTIDEITVGENFVVNGVEYTKTTEVRISCCRNSNCHVSSDVNQKTFFPSNTVVEVNG